MPPQPMGYNMSNSAGGYRGGRGGGFNSRAGMNSMPSYNRGGFQQPMSGGFQGTPMNGFQGSPMGGMQNYGGFQSRGGIMGGMRGGPMGMRGGRGAMSPSGMMGMPMGGMGMGGMGSPLAGMAMGMPQMNGGMGMQGMQGFHSHSNTSTPGSSVDLSAQTDQFTSSSPFSRQPVGPGYGARSHPSRVGFSASSRPEAHWASLTQYPSTAVFATPSHFPSTVIASNSVFISPPPDQGNTLKRTLSQPGQAGFQAHYNPAFFPQSQQAGGVGDTSWNPHGAKRTRQE